MTAAWPTGDPEFFDLLAIGVRERGSVACAPEDETDFVICDEFGNGNDFCDPAGIRGNFTTRYEVKDGVIVAAEVTSVASAVTDFQTDYGAWLEANDPDLYQSSYRGTGKFPFDTVADAQAAIARLDDFLAESDTYPLEQ